MDSNQSNGQARPQSGLVAQLDFRDYSEQSISQIQTPSKTLTKEEAISLIGQIQEQIEAVEDYMLRLRWCLGLVLSHTERPFGMGRQIIDDIIKGLWELHQVHANKTLLYECEKLYHVFSGNFTAFLAWIAEQKLILGRPVRWSDIQNLCLGGRNNPDVIGREEADQRDFRDAERGIEAIERIITRAKKGNEEAQGVIEAIQRVLRVFSSCLTAFRLRRGVRSI